MADKKPKFSLKDLVYKPYVLELKHDVRIAGELHKDYVVGTVTLRCKNDPVYLKEVIPMQADVHQKTVEKAKELKDRAGEEGREITDEEIQDEIAELYKSMDTKVIAMAIMDWDEDLFGVPFSVDNAIEILGKTEHTYFYNQIVNKYRETEDFLPNVDM